MSILWGLRPIPAKEASEVDVESLPDDDLCSRLLGLSRELLDLGRNWAIVHYLVTGRWDERTEAPSSWAVFGRYEIDGHSFFSAPEDVAAIARELSAITRHDIVLRLRVDQIQGLYRGHAFSHDGLAGCADEAEDLRDCYLQLARRGQGALIRLG